jgi:hypothetical protein
VRARPTLATPVAVLIYGRRAIRRAIQAPMTAPETVPVEITMTRRVVCGSYGQGGPGVVQL